MYVCMYMYIYENAEKQNINAHLLGKRGREILASLSGKHKQ